MWTDPTFIASMIVIGGTLVFLGGVYYVMYKGITSSK